MIELTYGGSFNANDLLKYIQKNLQSNYIIQGQINCKEDDHPKPKSLDYWLRQFASDRNRKLADNDIMSALVATGLFIESNELTCPTTGRYCKGLLIAI